MPEAKKASKSLKFFTQIEKNIPGRQKIRMILPYWLCARRKNSLRQAMRRIKIFELRLKNSVSAKRQTLSFGRMVSFYVQIAENVGNNIPDIYIGIQDRKKRAGRQ